MIALVFLISSLYFSESKKVISFFFAFNKGLIESIIKSSLNVCFKNILDSLIFFFLKKIFLFIYFILNLVI